MGQTIGRLERIRRYPVKSMAGEDISAIYVHETGVNGDRVFAFYDHESRRKGLPYFTGREKRELLLFQPRIIGEPDCTNVYPENYRPEIDITLPSGQGTYAVQDAAVMEYIKKSSASRDVSLTLDYRRAGIQDGKPISLIGLSTLEQIARESGVANLDPRQFRENFYVAWNTPEPFFEDGLVGRCLGIGDKLLLHVVKKNERCPMICINADSGEYDKRVLSAVVKQHEVCAGVYATVRVPGVVRNGDPVMLN